MLRLACDLRQRRWQYRKETLIAQFGGDVLSSRSGDYAHDQDNRGAPERPDHEVYDDGHYRSDGTAETEPKYTIFSTRVIWAKPATRHPRVRSAEQTAR
jgi:hypothetical protein